MDGNYDVIIFISKTFILRKPRVDIFAGNIKIVTMFVKRVFKDSKKLKESEIMYRNTIYICIS